MNATSIAELRGGGLPPEVADDKLDQVRDLLFGEYRRESDARIIALESRVRELESGVHRRLDLIQARLEALTNELASGQRASFDELSRSVFELGDRIRRISHG